MPTEELAHLEHLSRVVRLSEECKPPPARWPAAVGLAIALVCVTALLVVRVPETEITLDLETSEAGFTLLADKPVLGRAALNQLGVSGANGASLAPESLSMDLSWPADAIRNVRVTVPVSATGAINTAALILPMGTRTWLRFMDMPNTFRLSVKGPSVTNDVLLRADLSGRLEMAAPDALAQAQMVDFGKSGGTLQFHSRGEIFDVDFVTSDLTRTEFYSPLPASNLSLLRIEQFAASIKSLVTAVSTVLGGSLYFDSLGGEEYKLRPGERLDLQSAQGRIESLRLLTDRISLKYRARVRGIAVGDEATRRNLMPNLLQWLKARQPLSLVWATTFWLYGVVLSLLRWFRRSGRE